MAIAALGFRWTEERRFYGGYGLFVLLMVAAGFGPSWAHRAMASGPEAMTPLIWVHGLAFLAWVLLFVTQTALIAARDYVLHKRLGYASIGLVAAMLVLGVATGATQGLRGTVPPGFTAETWLAVPMFDLLAFAGLYVAGVAYRRNAQAHKRLMLMATLTFLYAAMGRFFPLLPPDLLGGEWTTVLAALTMLPVAVWDLRQRGQVHPATIAGFAALFGEQILRLLVWHSDAWHAIASLIVVTA